MRSNRIGSGGMRLTRWIGLARADFINTVREPMYAFVMIGPVLFGLLFRNLVPFATSLLAERVGFDLTLHYPFIMSFCLMMTPMLLGAVFAFLLLDERDDDILTYMSITPVSKTGYFLYKLGIPTLVSFAYAFVMLEVVRLTPRELVRTAPAAVVAALEAPLLTLFVAAVARNKVEGLTLYKAGGLIMAGAFLGYLLPGGWGWTGAVFPTFWVSKAYLAADPVNRLLYFLGGLGYHLAVVTILLRVFSRKAY